MDLWAVMILNVLIFAFLRILLLNWDKELVLNWRESFKNLNKKRPEGLKQPSYRSMLLIKQIFYFPGVLRPKARGFLTASLAGKTLFIEGSGSQESYL
jgi:hypothetical protein